MTRHDRLPVGIGLAAAAMFAALLAPPAMAQTPPPKPTPPPAAAKPQAAPLPQAKPGAAAQPAKPAAATPAPDPLYEPARLAWEVLPLADRVAVQDGLAWTGDYAGSFDGTFGRMTFASITAFQTRHKFAPDGILTAPALKLLADTATAKKTAVGFQPVDDKATGVRIHLPTKLLGPVGRGEAGSRWVGREGRLQIDTYAYPDGDLAAYFARFKAEAPGRKVVYSVLRPDWFVVSDEVGGRHGYARFVRGPQGIRGFVFTLDASLATELDRAVIATAGRFEPFPGAVTLPAGTGAGAIAAAAEATAKPGPAPTPQTPPAVPQTPPPGPKPAPLGAAASGLVVASGRVVTAAAAVAGCAEPLVAGKPATVIVPETAGLATLAIDGAAAGPVALGESLSGAPTVVAVGDGGGAPAVVAVPAEVADGRLRGALQRGAQGGVVIDGSGALVGLVLGRPDEKRSIAGLVPPAAYDLADPAALGAAITAAGGTIARPIAGTALTTGRSVALWAPRVVAVACRR